MNRSNQIKHLLTNLFCQVVTVVILLPCVSLASEEVSIGTNWGVVQKETDREFLERIGGNPTSATVHSRGSRAVNASNGNADPKHSIRI